MLLLVWLQVIIPAFYATLAQPAEQALRKRQVMGSSPMGGFNIFAPLLE